MLSVKQLVALSLSLLPAALGKKDCRRGNTPKTRHCWRGGFDINTDFELEAPPGKLVEYDLTISNQVVSPDGYLRDGVVINGQYPGPTIEADWGDTLRITVHNNLTNHNGTAIHWHGIHQYMTNWMDGVPGITQCPSKPGGTQVYEFKAMQYGTSWYHSHFGLQYSNAAYGALKINGPTSMNYDVDIGPLLLSDWYHEDAFALHYVELTTNLAPLPVSNVMNGKGVFDCDPTSDSRCTGERQQHEITFKRGKKYKLGLVNTASLLTYKFWIDGHKFTVVATDFVPIKPYETDVLVIGIGQRYDIIVEADASFEHGSNFWMHANYCDDENLWDSKLGIIRYKKNNHRDPYTPPKSEQPRSVRCENPPPEDLTPVVKRQIGTRVNGLDPSDYLKIGLQNYPNASDPNSRIHKWVLGDQPQYINWDDPSLKKIAVDSDPTFPPEERPVYLDFDTGEWVYFVILNNYTLQHGDKPQTIPRSVHPIHLHGHDFAILAQGKGEFTQDIVPNLSNPSRRDVADCPIGGYLWIAFQIRNPGPWMLHCHIAWHQQSGLSLQFIEQESQIKPLMEAAGVLPDFLNRCMEWNEYDGNAEGHAS